MARRSDHTRDQIREMAIQAGQKVIGDDGYAAFSARQVARDIGYTVGTLYNIFDGHDDIVIHINAATLDDLGTHMAAHHDPALTGANALRHLAAGYLAFAMANYNRWSALFEHLPRTDAPLPDWYREKIDQLFTIVEGPLRALVDVDQARAQRTAKTVWAGIHGICVLGLTGKLNVVGGESIESMMNDLVDNYVAGLARTASDGSR